MHRRRQGLTARTGIAVALAGVLAALLAFYWLESGTDHSAESEGRMPITSKLVDGASLSGVQAGSVDPIPSRLPAAGQTLGDAGEKQLSAREFLTSFLGAEAGPIIEHLEAKGRDLDSMGPPPVTWEEARMELGKRLLPEAESEPSRREMILEWPEKLSTEWLRRHYRQSYELDDVQLGELQSIAQPYLDRAESLYAEYRRGLDAEVLSKWSRGDFYYAPYTSWRPTAQMNNAIYAKADGYLGWAYSFTLTREDAPGLPELARQINDIIGERDAALRKFLKSH